MNMVISLLEMIAQWIIILNINVILHIFNIYNPYLLIILQEILINSVQDKTM